MFRFVTVALSFLDNTNSDQDGGGVRSYSSLLILEALMACVRVELHKKMKGNSHVGKNNETSQEEQIYADGAEVQNWEAVDPHEAFDYIFGSSSGG